MKKLYLQRGKMLATGIRPVTAEGNNELTGKAAD